MNLLLSAFSRIAISLCLVYSAHDIASFRSNGASLHSLEDGCF